ncbi:MAG: hypothetical protein MIO93_09635 [ANME-2 cluster archaeon]|nr:hypothetical protein [ANME-2 cluster archaeon]
MIYRKVVAKFVVILILLSVTVVPASAWGFDVSKLIASDKDYTKKLADIDNRVEEVSNDTEMMKCINFNMWEQKVKVIVIDITENDKVLKSYYIERGNEGESASISDVKGNGNAWVFRPTIKQTEKGLDILESNEFSARLVMRAIILYIAVDNDGPSISKIIKKSSWLEIILAR